MHKKTSRRLIRTEGKICNDYQSGFAGCWRTFCSAFIEVQWKLQTICSAMLVKHNTTWLWERRLASVARVLLSLKCIGETSDALVIHSSHPINPISDLLWRCIPLDTHQVKEREERKAAARQAEEAALDSDCRKSGQSSPTRRFWMYQLLPAHLLASTHHLLYINVYYIYIYYIISYCIILIYIV